MRKGIFLATILFLVTCNYFSQTASKKISGTQEITLSNIWNGTFSTERMNSLNSMNGEFYSVLNFDRVTKAVTVDKYSYKTLEKIETIGAITR